MGEGWFGGMVGARFGWCFPEIFRKPFITDAFSVYRGYTLATFHRFSFSRTILPYNRTVLHFSRLIFKNVLGEIDDVEEYGLGRRTSAKGLEKENSIV